MDSHCQDGTDVVAIDGTIVDVDENPSRKRRREAIDGTIVGVDENPSHCQHGTDAEDGILRCECGLQYRGNEQAFPAKTPSVLSYSGRALAAQTVRCLKCGLQAAVDNAAYQHEKRPAPSQPRCRGPADGVECGVLLIQYGRDGANCSASQWKKPSGKRRCEACARTQAALKEAFDAMEATGLGGSIGELRRRVLASLDPRNPSATTAALFRLERDVDHFRQMKAATNDVIAAARYWHTLQLRVLHETEEWDRTMLMEAMDTIEETHGDALHQVLQEIGF